MQEPSISVLVIAHNEEAYIEKCLQSLLVQTVTPKEILVVAHNCTDSTEAIIARYPQVTCISYQGPRGPIYARIEGFKQVSGEIIVCTDGDSYVKKNWVEEMSKPLRNPRITGVGGLVLSKNILVRRYVAPLFNFYIPQITKHFHARFKYFSFWGPSIALRKSDYERIGGLEPLLVLKESLGLSETPDDYYLAVMLGKIGKIVTLFNTAVYVVMKEESNRHAIERSRKQVADGRKLWAHLKDTQLV